MASGWRVRNHTTHYYLSTAEFSARTAPATCASTGTSKTACTTSSTRARRGRRPHPPQSRHRRGPAPFRALNLMRLNGEQCIAAALYDNALCLDNTLNQESGSVARIWGTPAIGSRLSAAATIGQLGDRHQHR